MNRVELIGNLVRPLDFFYTGGGYPYVRFTLAVNGEARYDPERKEAIASANFVSCVLFGPMADYLIEAGLEKGEKLYVLGEIDQSTIETAEGDKESKTRVKVHLIQRLTVAPSAVTVVKESPEVPDF